MAVCAAEGNPTRVDLEHGFYLVAAPESFQGEGVLPLVIGLHGTDSTAADILTFWRSFHHVLPMIFVAPQGMQAAWRETDTALIDEFLDHVSRTLRYDRERVLLAGHSAGGAMALHLLYVKGFPASAVAVTANYVPPTVKPEHVRRRCDVPVFYAVGETDVNRPRMREGLALLRDNGVSVTVERPNIGHVLDPRVGQAAMTWFEGLCRSRVDKTLAEAREVLKSQGSPADEAVALEDLLQRAAGQFPDQVTAATELLGDLQRPGRQGILRAETLLQQGRAWDARTELLEVEQRYRPSLLAHEARRRRTEIEALPGVAEVLRLERAATTEGQSGGS